MLAPASMTRSGAVQSDGSAWHRATRFVKTTAGSEVCQRTAIVVPSERVNGAVSGASRGATANATSRAWLERVRHERSRPPRKWAKAVPRLTGEGCEPAPLILQRRPITPVSEPRGRRCVEVDVDRDAAVTKQAR